jgi:hypothetical protein
MATRLPTRECVKVNIQMDTQHHSQQILLQRICLRQVDDEGNRHVLFEAIVDRRTDGTEVKQQDAFIKTRPGTQRRRSMTQGSEILVQWKAETNLGAGVSKMTLDDGTSCLAMSPEKYVKSAVAICKNKAKRTAFELSREHTVRCRLEVTESSILQQLPG